MHIYFKIQQFQWINLPCDFAGFDLFPKQKDLVAEQSELALDLLTSQQPRVIQ